MKHFAPLFLLSILFLCSCNSGDDSDSQIPLPEGMYFPPVNGDTWESVSVDELGWNPDAVTPLTDYLTSSGTRAFIILKNGRIAMEWYGNGADKTTNWQWNSAGKTLCAFTTGIAQEEGFLQLSDASSAYLGQGWSVLTPEQELNITVRHHLTMTTGLDYTVVNNNCTDPECLTYKNEPGTFWYYHNAPYTLIQSIISGATGTDFNTYFNTKLKNRIGMNGAWIPLGYFKIYYSNARSMARFGLLNLNKGVWDDHVILEDQEYFNAMTNTSQDLNKSYGYLWWLNGKAGYRLPGSEAAFTGALIPSAPSDLFAGMGKDDQRVYVVPSQQLVVVRLGENANESELGPSAFDNDLWPFINNLIE